MGVLTKFLGLSYGLEATTVTHTQLSYHASMAVFYSLPIYYNVSRHATFKVQKKLQFNRNMDNRKRPKMPIGLQCALRQPGMLSRWEAMAQTPPVHIVDDLSLPPSSKSSSSSSTHLQTQPPLSESSSSHHPSVEIALIGETAEAFLERARRQICYYCGLTFANTEEELAEHLLATHDVLVRGFGVVDAHLPPPSTVAVPTPLSTAPVGGSQFLGGPSSAAHRRPPLPTAPVGGSQFLGGPSSAAHRRPPLSTAPVGGSQFLGGPSSAAHRRPPLSADPVGGSQFLEGQSSDAHRLLRDFYDREQAGSANQSDD